MDSAARAYFYYHLQPTSDDTLHECKQDLVNVMKREVKLFMKHGEFFHDGYYSFTRKNFKCYLSSIDLEHPMEKINFYSLYPAIVLLVVVESLLDFRPDYGENSGSWNMKQE
jgi:hypothetical protein